MAKGLKQLMRKYEDQIAKLVFAKPFPEKAWLISFFAEAVEIVEAPPTDPSTEYLLGWVVGYQCSSIRGDNVFYCSRKGQEVGERYIPSGPDGSEQLTLHCGADLAERVARRFQAEDDRAFPDIGNQYFWKAWKYATRNPQNAKGLKPFPKEADGMIYWVNKEPTKGFHN